MANPRAKVDFTGIANRRATYNIDNVTITYDRTQRGGSAAIEKAVQMSGHSTVALVNDAQAVKGRLELVEADGRCVVATKGYLQLPRGTGAALTPGKRIVGDLLGAARGYIRDAAGGEEANARGEVIDASNAADGALAFVEF